MSATSPAVSSRSLFETLPWDDGRGTRAMLWIILTEAMLFVSLFFSYYYVSRNAPHWPLDEPPHTTYAYAMLAVLAFSSVLVEIARRQAKKGHQGMAKLFTAFTAICGLTYIGLQVFEYLDHLKRLVPTDDVYASIFYTTTTVHGSHVTVGVLMLLYTIFLPHVGPGEKLPHKPLHNVSLYWHFVDFMWLTIVILYYVLPNQ